MKASEGGMVVRKLLFLMGALNSVVAAGCFTHEITLDANVGPNVFTAQKTESTIGVLFAPVTAGSSSRGSPRRRGRAGGGVPGRPNLEGYVHSARPSGFYYSAHSYRFNLGMALCPALVRSAEAAYSNVVVTDDPEGHQRVVKFGLESADADIYFKSAGYAESVQVDYSLSIAIEVPGTDTAKPQRRKVVSGKGFVSRDIRSGGGFGGPAGATRHMAQAAEMAIQEICDKITRLLLSGFAEPARR